jgi:hypothetical protein
MGCPAYIPRPVVEFHSAASGTVKPGYDQIGYKPALGKRLQTSGSEFFYSQYPPSILIMPEYVLGFGVSATCLYPGFAVPPDIPWRADNNGLRRDAVQPHVTDSRLLVKVHAAA